MIITKTNNDQFEHERPRLDDEQRILGGSVTAICYHILTKPTGEASTLDDECLLFCSTIGFWAPVEVVLVEMTRIASRRKVADRLDAIIKYWCDCTPRVMWEEGSHEALLVLVDEGVTRVDSEKGHLLHEYVVEAEKRFKGLLHPDTDLDTDSFESISLCAVSYI